MGNSLISQFIKEGRKKHYQKYNDIQYCNSQCMDIYVPNAINDSDTLPVVVIIHGGSWVRGDKKDEREVYLAELLTRNNYICASINYKLATKDDSSWPECLYDCLSSIQYLKDNSAEYNIDKNKLGVIGSSAGGHMAAMTAICKDEYIMPNAIIDMYGISNLLKYKNNDTKMLIGGTERKKYIQASPYYRLDKNCPPILFIHGDKDTVVNIEHSYNMHNKLYNENIHSTFISVINEEHSINLRNHPVIRNTIVSFFNKHLK